MAIRVDSGDAQVIYIPQTGKTLGKKKKKKTTTTGVNYLPNGAVAPTAPTPKPNAGAVTSLKPLNDIIAAGGQLSHNDVVYLQQLAWTTKDDDNFNMHQAIEAARDFFKQNPKLNAGVDYNAFHKQGMTRQSGWYKQYLAQIDAEKFAKSRAGKLRAMHDPSLREPDPLAEENALLASLPPSMATGAINKKVVLPLFRSLFGDDALNKPLYAEKNITEIIAVDDVSGNGPGFVVTFVDGKKTDTLGLAWKQVPSRYRPGGAAAQEKALDTADIYSDDIALGGQPVTNQRMKMLNRVWGEVFAGTKVTQIPPSITPAMIADMGIKTPEQARAAFEALRDPYLLDERNPYRMNPEDYFSFYGDVEDVMRQAGNGVLDPVDTMAARGDIDPLAGILTPRPDEAVRTVSGTVLHLSNEDTLRLSGLLSNFAVELTNLPGQMDKAGQMLTGKQALLMGKQKPTNMLELLQTWAKETDPNIKVDGKSWSFEMDEAIRQKQFASALWRSLADPNDAEANLYLQNEWNLPDGAQGYLDNYLQQMEIPDINSPEMKNLTQEERDYLLQQAPKTDEEKKAELATRLAVESKLPYENDASAVYKLWKKNPDLVTPEYTAIFDRAKEVVEKTYTANFGKGLDLQAPTHPGKGFVPGTSRRERPLLAREDADAVVYAALNVVAVDMYKEEAEAKSLADARPQKLGGKGQVGKPLDQRGEAMGFMESLGVAAQQWNKYIHHPVATWFETAQLETGQKVAEGNKAVTGGKGKTGSGLVKKGAQQALADYTEYLTLQKLAHPEQNADDFKNYWSMASWEWKHLRERAGGGYINMGTYLMQEGDPNYKPGDNPVAEFLIDTVYELPVMMIGAGAWEVGKGALTGSRAYMASRGILMSKLGQQSVGDLAATIADPAVFVNTWKMSPEAAEAMGRARSLDDVLKVADDFKIDPHKFDPGAWDMPMRMKLGLQAEVRQHPFLERLTHIVGTSDVGGAVPLDVSAVQHVYEKSIAMGMKGNEALEFSNEATRILAGVSDGSDDFFRKFDEFAQLLDERANRTGVRQTVVRKPADELARASGDVVDVPKSASKQQKRRLAIDRQIKKWHSDLQKLDDDLTTLKRAKVRHGEETLRQIRIGELQKEMDGLYAQVNRAHELKRSLWGKPGRRPVTRVVDREMTEAEKIVGHRVFSDLERRNIEHNLRAFMEDFEQLLKERTMWKRADDEAYIRKFEKADPTGHWDELKRTASKEAINPEGEFDPTMLTDDFIRENGYVSEGRLTDWWQDRVRPDPKGREAKQLSDRVTGTNYAPKQNEGRGKAFDQSATTTPHDAVQLARARLALKREVRARQKELQTIAPRLAENEARLNARLRQAGINAVQAEVETHRIMIRQLADGQFTVDELRHFDRGTIDDFLNLALEQEVGKDIVDTWRKRWETLVSGLDANAVVAKTGKADLKTLQRRARSARAKKHTSDLFVRYGQMTTDKLTKELDKLSGTTWQAEADKLGKNVRVMEQKDWPDQRAKSLGYAPHQDPNSAGEVFIDRVAIKKAFDDNEWPAGMGDMKGSLKPRELADDADELEDLVAIHELAHATGTKKEGSFRAYTRDSANGIANRVRGRQPRPMALTREEFMTQRPPLAGDDVLYHGSHAGDITDIKIAGDHPPYGLYTTGRHDAAGTYAAGRMKPGHEAPEGRINYVVHDASETLDLNAPADMELWERIAAKMEMDAPTWAKTNEEAFFSLATRYGGLTEEDYISVQRLLDDEGYGMYSRAQDAERGMPHREIVFGPGMIERGQVRILDPETAYQRYLKQFTDVPDPRSKAHKRQIISKIIEQRNAEGPAINALRDEVDALQSALAISDKMNPQRIAGGNVPQSALGGYSPTAQPLLPSQMQQFYHPTYDTRLMMTWRLGKGARRLEVANTHPRGFLGFTSWDKASNVFKTVILARLATAIRIVLGDEATRFIPEGIDPIAAQHYIKEMLEYETKHGKVVIPPDLHVGLSRLYGVIRRQNYAILDPGDPEFLTAYRGMLRQWNADPMVREWKRIYRQDGLQAAHDWMAREAVSEADNMVNTHLRSTNRLWPAQASMKQVYGAMGADDYMTALRHAFESQNVDDWVEAAHGQLKFFAENKFTKRHFVDGEFAESGHFKSAHGAPAAAEDPTGVLPVVLGRMETGDIGGGKWYDPRTLFGSTLEGISGHFTEMTYAHFYMQERTRILASFAGKAGLSVDASDVHAVTDAMVKKLGREGAQQVMEEAERGAMQFGRQQVQRVMYTAGTSASEDLLRNIILFLPAQRQYMAYWSKAIFQHPWLLAYFHRLNETPDYLEFRLPWQDEHEKSRLFLRGLLFATPGFREDSPGEKVYSMIPGLGLPGVIAGAAAGTAAMAGYTQPQELMMKMPGGDFYKDTYRPLNTSLTQFAYGVGTLVANKPWQPMPEQVAGSNASNLWKFSEVLKATVSRAIASGDVSDENLPEMEGWGSAAREHGLKALLTAGWNFIVPMKLSIVDVDAQRYLDSEMGWDANKTYQERLDYITRMKEEDPLWYRVKELELATSPEERQRLMYNHPEVIPYYITNVGVIRPEGEEYNFTNVVEESKSVFMNKLRVQDMVELDKQIDKEERWFKQVYLPALHKREAWTGGNTALGGKENAAYTPDSPSNVMRIKKDFEEGSGSFDLAQGGITDPKTGITHYGLKPMRDKLTSAAYLSSSDFASDPDSSIYQATEALFQLKAGARYVRTSKAYSDFANLYRISHKEGEQEAIIAALQPFTQMSETELAAVFGKKWRPDEEWIRQRIASVWDQYTEAYKGWLQKTDKHGKKVNQGKDYGDFRYSDYGEAYYAAVTTEVYKYLAGPNSSDVLSGGIAKQLMNTPLVRPHLVVFEQDGSPATQEAFDPINDVERILDKTTGIFNQPGAAGAKLSTVPQALPTSDKAGARRIKFGDRVLPERLVAGIVADAALRFNGGDGTKTVKPWNKKDQAVMDAEAKYLKTYLKTADPIMKYNIRETQRAYAWNMLLELMDNLSTTAWGVPSEYQSQNSYYKGRSYSEKMTQSIIRQVKKKWLPVIFKFSPLFEKEFEFYNDKAGGNIVWDMLNTYR